MATKQELINRLNNLKLSDAPWEAQDQAVYQLLQDLINTAFELSGETGTIAINNVDAGEGIIATGSDNSQDKTIFSIQRKEVLDTNQQPREDTRIQSIGDISFYTGGEVGTEVLRVMAEGTVVTNSLLVSKNNAMGGGIILADDGDIVDLNDGYCSMRFSNGVKIYSASRAGNLAIEFKNNGDVNTTGNISTGNLTCNNIVFNGNNIFEIPRLRVQGVEIDTQNATEGQVLTKIGSKFVAASVNNNFSNAKADHNSNLGNESYIDLASTTSVATVSSSTTTINYKNTLSDAITLYIDAFIYVRRDSGGDEFVRVMLGINGMNKAYSDFRVGGDSQVPCIIKYNHKVAPNEEVNVSVNAFDRLGLTDFNTNGAWYFGKPIVHLLAI